MSVIHPIVGTVLDSMRRQNHRADELKRERDRQEGFIEKHMVVCQTCRALRVATKIASYGCKHGKNIVESYMEASGKVSGGRP